MRSSYPLIINIRMFLRAQPNSRKISYDSIRKWKRFGFSRIRILNHSRRYPHGKSAAAAVVSVEISTRTRPENSKTGASARR